ncbi:hypothetical protein AB0M47_27280 [Hamadaea sp. NPDC051192]|uniref:hypothetical protein n=1 Tax=Hamadaea sp. NPDC051192 TaxID=3154940 RepID=UPI00343CFF4F
MGRIEKKLSDSTTKYYWYPGEKQEWIRAAVAVGVGAAVAALLMLMTHNSVAAVVVGTSATLAMAGFNFGRRDSKALAGFLGMADKAARRAAIGHTGRAAWRGLVMGVGSAAAAVLVINLSPEGWLYDWLLPVVPAVVCAVARQIGLVWEKLGTTVATKGPAAEPAKATPPKAVPSDG